MTIRQALDSRTVAAQLRAHLQTLAGEVDDVKQSREFQQVLDVMAVFWRYSPLNQWLIRCKRPSATRIAGRRTWEKLGRQLVPGTKPIYIFAPTGKGFVGVPVFDIAQTQGPELPELDLLLTGETDQVRRLERAARNLGVRVAELTEGPPTLLGVSTGGEVRIRAGLPAMERAATLAHELAHELLHTGERATEHGRQLSETARETEAEATAYIVLRVLGLPSKAPAYIAWRGGSGALIVESMNRIRLAARTILDAARRKKQ